MAFAQATSRMADAPMRFLACVMVLAIIPAFAIQTFLTSPYPGRAVLSFVADEDYLESLRNSTRGCNTLYARAPQLAFVGDSHSYAGWDFVSVKQATGAGIGGCMMGGLFIDTLPPLLDFLRALSSPRQIVFGTSPRIFWTASRRDEQVAAHIASLKALRERRMTLAELVSEVRAASNFRRGEEAKLELHRPSLLALSNRVVTDKLVRSRQTLPVLASWHKLLEERPLDRQTIVESITESCRLVKIMRAQLTLIHIPESPYLESLYSKEQLSDYESNLSLFKACSSEIVLKGTAHYGLQNVDYVNRMLHDIDYDSFARPAPLSDPRMFDPDHMNPLGARKFTEIAVRELRLATFGK